MQPAVNLYFIGEVPYLSIITKNQRYESINHFRLDRFKVLLLKSKPTVGKESFPLDANVDR